jgi:hypothetical protein
MVSKLQIQKISEKSDKNDEKLIDLNQNNEQIMRKLSENNDYFSSLIDLIPAKIYFEGNEEMIEVMEKNKKFKFSDEMDLSVRAKHKRFKLDPNNNQKVSQIAQQFYNNSKDSKDFNLNNNKTNNKINKLDDLKLKLNERIEKLKSIRGGKQNAKNFRETKRERKKNNSIRSSKQKGFIKNKSLNNQINQQNNESIDKKNKKQKLNGSQNSDKSDKLPKIYNRDGNLVFSKFDFVSPLVENDVNQKKKNKKSLNKLLVKAKKEEQKLSHLEEMNPLAAKQMKDKKLWRNAIEKSEGIKVRDNSKLIEKSLMKKKKLKIKSKKEWKERKESLEKKMKSKEEKRKHNINDRLQQIKARKLSKARKKGRIIGGK